MSAVQRLRCAVYTRKSTEEGLDQEFNSLDAQREACSAFIASQVGLGWKLVPDRYDDGGISGGTMERPALKRLLADIAGKRVDVVVVYKIDRLTRSLTDFAKIVEVLDGNGVSFVSVTQQFNTTTSMGRLTLNVLLSFAQFEREVTAERIRDKIAASKAKGMWMGGTVPLGYQVKDRKLLIKEPEASFVRALFTRYLELKSVPAVAAEVTRAAIAAGQQDDLTTASGRAGFGDGFDARLDVGSPDVAVPGDASSGHATTEHTTSDVGSADGAVSDGPVSGDASCNAASCDRPRSDRPSSDGASQTYVRRVGSGMLYKLLSNPIYVGRLKHRQNVHEGEHQPIVDPDLFDEVQRLLASQAATPRGSSVNADVHLLTGILFDDTGDRMSPTHAKAHGTRYRYYISSRIKGKSRTDNTAWRIPASEIETIAVQFVTNLLADQSQLVDWIGRYATNADLKRCLDQANDVGKRLVSSTPAKQRTIILSLVQSITLASNAIAFKVRASDLVAMLQDGSSPRIASKHTGGNDGDCDAEDVSPLQIINMPITIKRRGNEMRLVLHGAARHHAPDPQLVGLIARANLYLQHLTKTPGTSVSDVAAVFGVHRVDVGRILPLAFLAPNIVDQILTGNHPDHISARQLARANLPLLWSQHASALN
ncbi:MAG: recombinase family protein [Rhizobiaceae bacterium]|nr:recombinase family protein [Rhizobiaceae bacterium]